MAVPRVPIDERYRLRLDRDAPLALHLHQGGLQSFTRGQPRPPTHGAHMGHRYGLRTQQQPGGQAQAAACILETPRTPTPALLQPSAPAGGPGTARARPPAPRPSPASGGRTACSCRGRCAPVRPDCEWRAGCMQRTSAGQRRSPQPLAAAPGPASSGHRPPRSHRLVQMTGTQPTARGPVRLTTMLKLRMRSGGKSATLNPPRTKPRSGLSPPPPLPLLPLLLLYGVAPAVGPQLLLLRSIANCAAPLRCQQTLPLPAQAGGAAADEHASEGMITASSSHARGRRASPRSRCIGTTTRFRSATVNTLPSC